MFKRNQLYTAVVAASLLAASTASLAETVNSTATVTVQNTFNLTEVAPISFGTLRAVADPAGTTQATYAVAANGSTTSPTQGTNATLTVLAPGTRGEYSVDGAAAFTDLTITFPSAAIAMTNAAAPAGIPDFYLNTTWEAVVIGGANDGQAYTGADLQTDVTGAVGFYLGGTISTDTAVSTAAYSDGNYSASYTIEVDY